MRKTRKVYAREQLLNHVKALLLARIITEAEADDLRSRIRELL